MKTKKHIMRLCAFLVVLIAACSESPRVLNPNFEKEMVKALNIKFVNSDTLYRTPFTSIINDTIVGYKWHSYGENDKDYYFLQSLKNLQYKKIFKSNLGYISPSYINELKEGCLYFGGPNVMNSVCTDGTTKRYFENTDILYVNTVTLYKNKVVVCSMRGIYVLDIKTQKILWHYRHGSVGFRRDNTFVFYGGVYLGCVDLDKISLVWEIDKRKTNMKVASKDNTIPSNTKMREDYHDTYYGISVSKSRDRFIDNTKRIIDSKTGKVLFSDSKINHLETDGDEGYMGMIDSSAVYLNHDFKIKWALRYAKIMRSHNNYVIAVDKSEQYLLIIDKITGKVKNKILRQFKDNIGIVFIGDYIMFNGSNLYK